MFNDADCGFCMRTGAQVHRLGVDVEPRTLQAEDLGALGIDEERSFVEMAAIDAAGRIHYGHRAWAAILRTGALPWRALAAAMTHPPFEPVARATYRWVSENREKLPGGTPACAMPSSPAVSPPSAPPSASQT